MSLEQQIRQLGEQYKAGTLPRRAYMNRLVRLRGRCGKTRTGSRGGCVMPQGHRGQHVGPWCKPDPRVWSRVDWLGMLTGDDRKNLRTRLRWDDQGRHFGDVGKVGSDVWPAIEA